MDKVIVYLTLPREELLARPSAKTIEVKEDKKDG